MKHLKNIKVIDYKDDLGWCTIYSYFDEYGNTITRVIQDSKISDGFDLVQRAKKYGDRREANYLDFLICKGENNVLNFNNKGGDL